MSSAELPEESKPTKPSDATPPAPRAQTGNGFFGRPAKFIDETRLEMKKVSWPTRSEVMSTTMIVLIAVVFFSAYLWVVDNLLTLFFNQLEEWML